MEMEMHESGNHEVGEAAESYDPPRPDGLKVFEADAWIPMWEQSIPGQRIALDTVPTSCNLYLEPEPYFAIEVNLRGEAALKHHRIITQQGEQVPMQFEGLRYGNYPIRGNNYVKFRITNDEMHLHAQYRLLEKGLRTLSIVDNGIDGGPRLRHQLGYR